MTGRPSMTGRGACGPLMTRSGRGRAFALRAAVSCPLRQRDTLAGAPGALQVERALVVRQQHPVGDDRRDVEALLEQRRGAVPGLEHAPAGDAVDADALEEDLLREVQRGRPRG